MSLNTYKVQVFNDHGKWSIRDNDITDEISDGEWKEIEKEIEKEMIKSGVEDPEFEIDSVKGVKVSYDPDALGNRFEYMLSVSVDDLSDDEEEGEPQEDGEGYIDNVPRHSNPVMKESMWDVPLDSESQDDILHSQENEMNPAEIYSDEDYLHNFIVSIQKHLDGGNLQVVAEDPDGEEVSLSVDDLMEFASPSSLEKDAETLKKAVLDARNGHFYPFLMSSGSVRISEK